MNDKETNGVRRFFFPLHLDAGNRGCEAIARGTIEILGIKPNQYICTSRYYENDLKLELVNLFSYINPKKNFIYYVKEILMKCKKKISRNISKKKLVLYSFKYDKFLNSIGSDDITLITGGDMLCYGNNEVNYIVDKLDALDRKIIIWGCSVGKENLTPEKIEALKKVEFISARDSITYNLLVNDLKLNNVMLVADPAFVLKPESCELPDYFSEECVGINLSNFVGDNVDINTIFGKNILYLLEYIIDNTKLNVILIPHVFWPEQNDYKICKYYAEIMHSNRIHLLNTENMNYCQIRYAIQKCRYFIGSRTHAVISAYSTCTPALALGYSVKSRGIARDLGLPEETVIDYRNICNINELTKRFVWLMENESLVQNVLNANISLYIEEAYKAKIIIQEM